MLRGVTRDDAAAHGGAAAIDQRSLMRGLGAATQGRGIHRRLHEGKAQGEHEKELTEHTP